MSCALVPLSWVPSTLSEGSRAGANATTLVGAAPRACVRVARISTPEVVSRAPGGDQSPVGGSGHDSNKRGSADTSQERWETGSESAATEPRRARPWSLALRGHPSTTCTSSEDPRGEVCQPDGLGVHPTETFMNSFFMDF